VWDRYVRFVKVVTARLLRWPRLRVRSDPEDVVEEVFEGLGTRDPDTALFIWKLRFVLIDRTRRVALSRDYHNRVQLAARPPTRRGRDPIPCEPRATSDHRTSSSRMLTLRRAVDELEKSRPAAAALARLLLDHKELSIAEAGRRLGHDRHWADNEYRRYVLPCLARALDEHRARARLDGPNDASH